MQARVPSGVAWRKHEDLPGRSEGSLASCVTRACAAVRAGAIQPVDEIGALCRERKAFFHTDAAQAVGKVGARARLPRLGWVLRVSANMQASCVTCTILSQRPTAMFIV
jgi:hypothetical protein